MACDGCNCYFSFWAIFCPFNPPLPPSPNNPKNKNFKKRKKTPGDVIILNKWTKHYDHMVYCP